MSEVLRALWEVHEADGEARRLEEETRGLDDGRKLRRLIEQLEGKLSKAEEQLKRLHGEQREAELSLAAAEERKRGYEREMGEGLVTNPKELRDMQREIEFLGERADGLETKILELMEQTDRVKGEAGELERKVRAGGKKLAAVESEYKEKMGELQERLEELGERRAAAAAQAPTELLSRYEDIRTSAGGVGMARVQGGACGMCKIVVASLTARRAEEEGKVVICEGCGRILYFGGREDG